MRRLAKLASAYSLSWHLADLLTSVACSDAVFGVKTSLIVDPKLVTDEAEAKSHGFRHGPFWHLRKDYVLLTKDQAEEQKKKSLVNYYGSVGREV